MEVQELGGKLHGLDLFSGYGGITRAINKWVTPVAYCEIERYPQGILLSRMAEGKLPVAPIWDDVTTLNGNLFREQIDIIYGGFPCQDISVAGNGKGLEGKRSGLFYEVCRLVEEIQPRFVFLENVPAIRTRGLREVIREFTAMGYDCRWTCVSAGEIGAPHLRKRWFLLAHTNCERLEGQREKSSGIKKEQQDTGNTCGWKVTPYLGRVDDGTTFRVDRIKSLGNGVVPSQVKEAFRRLIGGIL